MWEYPETEVLAMTQKGKILAIDDEEPIRLLYERALTSAGYDVSLAADGFQALAHVQREHFDVVLMDIVMPDLDGIEAITVLKSASSTPIIVVTGHAREQAIEFARRAGANRVVHKPFHVPDLIEAVERTISHPDEIDTD